MLANVKQATIKPIIIARVAAGALINTDEYDIYARLPEWGYGHKSVCHARGEYARDEDGDGFHEVHVNTIEGFWSLLRSWLRPHRGISQEKLPLYLAFFQFTHNARKRGKAEPVGRPRSQKTCFLALIKSRTVWSGRLSRQRQDGNLNALAALASTPSLSLKRVN